MSQSAAVEELGVPVQSPVSAEAAILLTPWLIPSQLVKPCAVRRTVCGRVAFVTRLTSLI